MVAQVDYSAVKARLEALVNCRYMCNDAPALSSATGYPSFPAQELMGSALPFSYSIVR